MEPFAKHVNGKNIGAATFGIGYPANGLEAAKACILRTAQKDDDGD
jgi:hypothetical protein